MEENLGNAEQLDNSEKTNKAEPSKWKKGLKWIFVGLGLIALFCLLIILTLELFFSIKPNGGIVIGWFLPVIILIPLFMEMIICSIIYWKLISKLKKYSKYILIMLFLFLVFMWFCLTKCLIIPDYFEFNCLGEKKVINEDCIDCKCKIIYHAPPMQARPFFSEDGNLCCEGTYKVVKTGIN